MTDMSFRKCSCEHLKWDAHAWPHHLNYPFPLIWIRESEGEPMGHPVAALPGHARHDVIKRCLAWLTNTTVPQGILHFTNGGPGMH